MKEGKINLSPKGLDSLKIIDANHILWLNLTGSGNETAAHLLHSDRITMMFCAFHGPPMILRLYGSAKVYHQRDDFWEDHISLFPSFTGSRQLIDMEIGLVQTSCGFGVPFMEFQGERDLLEPWATEKGEEGLKEYMRLKNSKSLDGYPTRISD